MSTFYETEIGPIATLSDPLEFYKLHTKAEIEARRQNVLNLAVSLQKGLFIYSPINMNKFIYNVRKLQMLMLLRMWLGMHYVESLLESHQEIEKLIIKLVSPAHDQTTLHFHELFFDTCKATGIRSNEDHALDGNQTHRAISWFQAS